MIKDKLFILTAEGCPGCEVVKKAAKGRVPVYDVTKDDDATRVAMQTGVRSVPTAVKRGEKGYSKCKLDLLGNKVEIDCQGEKTELEKK